MNAPLLSIEGLDVRFAADGGELRALHGVDLEVAAGEVVGLVGESGCGQERDRLGGAATAPRTTRPSGRRTDPL